MCPIPTKSTERILGDSGFVESVRQEPEDSFETKCLLRRKGINVELLTKREANRLAVDVRDVWKTPIFRPDGVLSGTLWVANGVVTRTIGHVMKSSSGGEITATPGVLSAAAR